MSSRGPGLPRRLRPRVEGLDRRELMSGGLSQSLGPYVSPSPLGPRIKQPAKVVDAHSAVQQFLATVLGPGLPRLQSTTQPLPRSPQAVLKQAVLNQPFVHAVLSDQDTYLLLQSPAFNALIGSQQVSGPTSQVSNVPAASTTGTSTAAAVPSTSSTSSGTATAASVPGTIPATSTTFGAASTSFGGAMDGAGPGTIPSTTPVASAAAASSSQVASAATGTSTASDPLIAFSIPDQAVIQSVGTLTSVVQVKPTAAAAGFFVDVPTANIRILDNGPPVTGTVLIAQSAIPPGFPVPSTSVIPIGTFSSTYLATAPLLNQIFNAGLTGVAPNAPNSVPGLRLVPFLRQSNPFPNEAARKDLLKALRLAVQRNVFALNASQDDAVTNGVALFADQVQAMSSTGEFVPLAPPAPPGLPRKALSGTLQVSAGVLRELASVDPSLSGLQLPSLGNFPGRLDVGYVFDRSGNFGIVLTARGVLTNANPGLAPGDIASGDVRVEVSDAKGLGSLSGSKVIEGVELGSLVSTDLETSRNANGVTTFSASAGNGFGFEYGTGVGYSQVVPLGNVYALIPSAPRR